MWNGGNSIGNLSYIDMEVHNLMPPQSFLLTFRQFFPKESFISVQMFCLLNMIFIISCIFRHFLFRIIIFVIVIVIYYNYSNYFYFTCEVTDHNFLFWGFCIFCQIEVHDVSKEMDLDLIKQNSQVCFHASPLFFENSFVGFTFNCF